MTPLARRYEDDLHHMPTTSKTSTIVGPVQL